MFAKMNPVSTSRLLRSVGCFSVLKCERSHLRFISILTHQNMFLSPKPKLYRYESKRQCFCSSSSPSSTSMTSTHLSIDNHPASITSSSHFQVTEQCPRVYEDENIIALNKPQSISVYGSNASSKDCINMSLADIASKSNNSYLEIGLSLKSYYSGIILLCKTAMSKRSLEKFIKTTASQKIPFMTYLAITLGVPQCSHGIQMQSFVTRSYMHKKQISVVSTKDNHKSRKDNTMAMINYVVEPLSVNDELGVALVKITLNRDKFSAVECLLSHHASPVLGDHIYSPRVSTLMGMPFSVTPESAPPRPQRLPDKLQEKLSQDSGTSFNSQPQIHRYQLHMSKFPSRKSPPVVISAKPSPQFMSTIKSLGLKLDDQILLE